MSLRQSGQQEKGAGKRARGNRRACAVLLCMAMASGASPALAAPDAGVVEQRRAYDIPAGPLGAALTALASQGHVALAFTAGQTDGKATAGAHGLHTMAEALAMLLRGTGLQAVAAGDGSYVLTRAPQERDATLMPAVKVQARTDDAGVTEGSGSYTTASSNTATRLDLSPRETPQTVNVITREVMDDFVLTDLEKVLQVTPGVYVSKKSSQDNYEFTSRGYEMQTQYDGIPDPFRTGEGYSSYPPDSATLDRIEVQQGAAGLLSGAGEPGGVVNLVRKLPTASPQASIEAQAGSWQTSRVTGDVSGALGAAGRLRGRLVGVHQENESFVDGIEGKKNVLYGVLQADLRPGTLLTAGYESQVKYDSTGDSVFGTPRFDADGNPLSLPRSFGITAPWASDDSSQEIAFARLDQQLPGDWSLRAAVNHRRATLDKITTYLFFGTDAEQPTDITIGSQSFDVKRRVLGLDLYASGSFALLGRRHELVLGFNGNRSHEDSNWFYSDPLQTVNIDDYDASKLPDYRSVVSFPVTQARGRVDNTGFYTASRISIADPLKLIAGLRVSHYESRDNGANGFVGPIQRAQKKSGVVSPYAGLVWDLGQSLSAYASYSDIFKTKSNRDPSGGVLEPTLGSNYEAGIKGAFYNGALNTYAAVFRIQQTRLAEPVGPFDPDNVCAGQCYAATGDVVSQGIDTGIAGELVKGLQVLAGYSYVDHRYASGDLDGQRYDNGKPRHTFKLGAMADHGAWSAGGSLRWQSALYKLDNFYTYDIDTDEYTEVDYRNEQKSFFLLGLVGQYRIDARSELALNIDNLLDEKYRADVQGVSLDFGSYIYGDPRRITLSYQYRFR